MKNVSAGPPPTVAEAMASKSLRRRRSRDRRARLFVSTGGMAIIIVILGILAFVIAEVLPLFRGARVKTGQATPGSFESPAHIFSDPNREFGVFVNGDGRYEVRRRDSGEVSSDGRLVPEGVSVVKTWRGPGTRDLGFARSDGIVTVAKFDFETTFVKDRRVTTFIQPKPVDVKVESGNLLLSVSTGRLRDDGSALVVAQTTDGAIEGVLATSTTNEFSGETETSEEVVRGAKAQKLSNLLLRRDGSVLYGVSTETELLAFERDGKKWVEPVSAKVGTSPITAISFLIGEDALLIGQADGGISVWQLLRGSGGERKLSRIRSFDRRGASIRSFTTSSRDRSFLVHDASNRIGLYYSTSERHLADLEAPVEDALALEFCPKNDAVLVAGPRRYAEISIDNPHPEFGFKACFGKVWYEGAHEPAHVWQSSSGSNEYEPKLGFVPLIFGTLKGTFFALLLAVPVAVLAAMYASQFMHPSLKRVVKPTVEIMASLPSVVLGFIAGLWLAPIAARVLPGLFLLLFVLPIFILLAGMAWRKAAVALNRAPRAGVEILFFMAAIVLGTWFCLSSSEAIESVLFGGDYRQWLLDTFGIKFDQGNSIVVSLAMAFAVIPIIFTISEDAFSNVPRGLTLGSLALGANRWQTVTRVVLPTASPGVFSAIMIGFGRAVGETMIVLMAAGNTPIMSLSPFNGFRTLSANIAVEIPEASHGSTLYRSLFLAALLLFIMTFIVNTAAEVVRDRLRKRYANL